MSNDSWSITLDRALASASVVAFAETIVGSPSQTIVPTPASSGGDVGVYLEALAKEAGPGLEARLRLEGTLGEGGMGVVHLAEQRSLGRKVALKSLKPGIVEKVAIETMLKEAFVTGHVEHPSVVPIHDIVLDAEGRPSIVLKRIEGQPWEALIGDAKAVRRRFGAEDLFEWNLSILLQVANAVAYAHSRGIVHRDLKPENVMIGEFGEVYLVDWGIAVAVDPDADPRLPRLREEEPMAGTPCYMAPEMLGGRGAPIGRATDVYLLGAVLYEIICGQPPHDGETLQEVVGSIVISEPPIPEHVPEDLVRILRRALDRDPHARFENAVQFRLALQGFLRHQGSRRLAEEAARRRRALEDLLVRVDAGEAVDEALLESTYAECRFGYLQAIRAWTANESAEAALAEVVTRFARFQLGRGQPRLAASAIAGMEEALPELAAEIARAVAAKERELAELERLGRELDPQAGRRTRAFLAIVGGSLWTATPLLGYVPAIRHVPEGEALAILPLVLVVLLGAIVYWARESMTRAALNRFLAVFVGATLVTQSVFAWGALQMGVDSATTFRFLVLLWGLAATTVGIVAQWRMGLAALGYLAAFVHLLSHPEDRLWVSSLCHAFTTVMAVFIWAPSEGPARIFDVVDPNRSRPMTTYRVPFVDVRTKEEAERRPPS